MQNEESRKCLNYGPFWTLHSAFCILHYGRRSAEKEHIGTMTAHAVHLKPLRERVEEIVPLAQEFLRNFNSKSGRNVWAKDEVLRQLEAAPWQGNIRELRSFVEKACLDALFAADAAAGDRARKIVLTREIVETRLNNRAVTAGSSPSSPLGPWPQFSFLKPHQTASAVSAISDAGARRMARH